MSCCHHPVPLRFVSFPAPTPSPYPSSSSSSSAPSDFVISFFFFSLFLVIYHTHHLTLVLPQAIPWVFQIQQWSFERVDVPPSQARKRGWDNRDGLCLADGHDENRYCVHEFHAFSAGAVGSSPTWPVRMTASSGCQDGCDV